MTIAFIRTYNNKQNSEVQEAVIREFAESQKIEIGKWAKEVGNSPRANRRLESIVKSLSPGDEILVSDISRVSRKMIEIIHIILLCIERKVTLRSVSDGIIDNSKSTNLNRRTLEISCKRQYFNQFKERLVHFNGTVVI